MQVEDSTQKISNADVIRSWSNVSTEAIETFGDEGDFTRRYLLNPALFALLGDVTDKNILDAGCGQGYLCRMLARKRARVMGLEPATSWYSYAFKREQEEPLGISYVQADLSTWFWPAQTFDYVIANMVLMDIPDLLPALHTCLRVLKNNGGLIFSLLHPCFEESGALWKEKGAVAIEDYFRERAVRQQNHGYFFHRPLSTYLNGVIQVGGRIQRVLEPQLDEAIGQEHGAERYCRVPGYIVVYATKGSAVESRPSFAG